MTAVVRLTEALADRYRIERELGQGGMATVYLAEDLRHHRRVALKVLRAELAAVIGAERFLHEITTTANLQHPHILGLHDSGQVDGTVFYVMPFIDGESLRDRLNREKQLPVEDAVKIAREVASALDYAHRHGVIHRDIKPENILLHDGSALVADFGIALAASKTGGSRMTETGMSLGTPHYMSPEQAMGERELTARSDVYALGCVLYEMLAGEPPFTGPTPQAIVARVVTEEPRSLSLQRKTIPPNVEASVQRALQKLPADRFATAAQFAEALITPTAAFTRTGETASTRANEPAARWRAIAVVVSVAAVAAMGIALWALTRTTASPGPVSRFAIVLDSNAPIAYSGTINEPPRLAISPDGGELVYTGRVRGAGQALYLRAMDRLGARLLPGTDSAIAPAISPDGAQVAFLTGWRTGDQAIKVVSLGGGPPILVHRGDIGSNLSWGVGGFVYFLDAAGRTLRRVASSGGASEEEIRLADTTATYRYVSVLPGGRAALVAAFPTDLENEAGYHLRGVDLKSGKLGPSVQGVAGVYTSSGHLLYVTYNGTLMGVAFDAKALEPRGRPVALIEGLDVRVAGGTDLAVSESGTLAYARAGHNAPEDFVWVSRSGEVTVVDPDWTDPEFENFELSPDGKRVAVTIAPLSRDRQDVWIKQLDRGANSRLTFGGTGNWSPSWSSDGRYVSFLSVRGGPVSLWRRRADGVGAEELVAKLPNDIVESRWSADGAWLLLTVDAPASLDVYAMRLGVDSAPRPLLTDSHDEGLPAISHDGRWMAYVSTETGSEQLFVRPFPAVQDGKWQLSRGGADAPLWSRGTRELLFRSADGTGIYSIDLSRGPDQASPRKVVQLPAAWQFETNGLGGQMFGTSPDGRRFLMVRQGAGDKSGDLVIVQNFFTELRATLAGKAAR